MADIPGNVTGATATTVEALDAKGVANIGTTSTGAHVEAHSELNTLTNRRYPDGPGKIEYLMVSENELDGSGNIVGANLLQGEDNWYRIRGSSNTKYVMGTADANTAIDANNDGTVVVQSEVFLEGGILIEVPDSATGLFKGSSQNRRFQKHFYPGTVFRNLSVASGKVARPRSKAGTGGSSSDDIVVYSTDTQTVHIPTLEGVVRVLHAAGGTLTYTKSSAITDGN